MTWEAMTLGAMTVPLNLRWLAAGAFERMLYCLAEGSALVMLMAIALRAVPQKNSQTRFAMWFATLLAVITLPLLQFAGATSASAHAASLRPTHALLTISASWAEYIILGWVVLAGLGLLRVAVGVWQIRRLRQGCAAFDPRHLPRELQAELAEFRKRRSVSILVSPTVDVPTAVGFLRPAVLIPAWLAEASASEELKHVLLHELAHLRRWDDWTNLAQKLVKAVLFFHPGVWWIERKLSLEREMACDDAVLSRIPSPRAYAECLARVAEKSFLERQLALAQAAVSRMKQLSHRVARILAEDRPRSTRMWKPALPLVIAAAGVCAVSTYNAPELVRLSDDNKPLVAASSQPTDLAPSPPTADSRSSKPHGGNGDAVFTNAPAMAKAAKFTPASMNAALQPKAWQASAKSRAVPSESASLQAHRKATPNLARKSSGRDATATQSSVQNLIADNKPSPPGAQDEQTSATEFLLAQSQTVPGDKLQDGLVTLAMSETSQDQLDRTSQGEVVLLIVTTRQVAVPGLAGWNWQIRTWELRAVMPANHPAKQIPSKT